MPSAESAYQQYAYFLRDVRIRLTGAPQPSAAKAEATPPGHRVRFDILAVHLAFTALSLDSLAPSKRSREFHAPKTWITDARLYVEEYYLYDL
jgi:hypothetical protein